MRAPDLIQQPGHISRHLFAHLTKIFYSPSRFSSCPHCTLKSEEIFDIENFERELTGGGKGKGGSKSSSSGKGSSSSGKGSSKVSLEFTRRNITTYMCHASSNHIHITLYWHLLYMYSYPQSSKGSSSGKGKGSSSKVSSTSTRQDGHIKIHNWVTLYTIFSR